MQRHHRMNAMHCMHCDRTASASHGSIHSFSHTSMLREYQALSRVVFFRDQLVYQSILRCPLALQSAHTPSLIYPDHLQPYLTALSLLPLPLISSSLAPLSHIASSCLLCRLALKIAYVLCCPSYTLTPLICQGIYSTRYSAQHLVIIITAPSHNQHST